MALVEFIAQGCTVEVQEVAVLFHRMVINKPYDCSTGYGIGLFNLHGGCLTDCYCFHYRDGGLLLHQETVCLHLRVECWKRFSVHADGKRCQVRYHLNRVTVGSCGTAIGDIGKDGGNTRL